MTLWLRLLLTLLAASALAGLALWRKALTRGGLILAWALALVICFCGGLSGYLALVATFVFTIAAGKLLMKDGELVGIDEEAENAYILERSQKLWGDLNGCEYGPEGERN